LKYSESIVFIEINFCSGKTIMHLLYSEIGIHMVRFSLTNIGTSHCKPHLYFIIEVVNLNFTIKNSDTKTTGSITLIQNKRSIHIDVE
jgi:hypothetical protein